MKTKNIVFIIEQITVLEREIMEKQKNISLLIAKEGELRNQLNADILCNATSKIKELLETEELWKKAESAATTETAKKSAISECKKALNKRAEIEKSISLANELASERTKKNKGIDELKILKGAWADALCAYNEAKYSFEDDAKSFSNEVQDFLKTAEEEKTEVITASSFLEVSEEVEVESNTSDEENETSDVKIDLPAVEDDKTEEEDDGPVEIKKCFNNPIWALESVMKRFDDLFLGEDTVSNQYDKSYEGLWDDINLSAQEKELLLKFFEEEEVYPLTKEQTRQLAFSFPTKLLEKLGKDDIISDRESETEIYRKGARNEFRKGFTYNFIYELRTRANEIIETDDGDNESEFLLAISKRCMETFFENNSDRYKKNFFGTKSEEGAMLIVE